MPKWEKLRHTTTITVTDLDTLDELANCKPDDPCPHGWDDKFFMTNFVQGQLSKTSSKVETGLVNRLETLLAHLSQEQTTPFDCQTR